MTNHITALVSFQFDYDGTTSTVQINTQRGPLFFSNPCGLPGLITSQYNSTATGVENVTVASINSGSIVLTNNSQTTTTGTVAGGVLTVNMPSGLIAGPYYCQATLIF